MIESRPLPSSRLDLRTQQIHSDSAPRCRFDPVMKPSKRGKPVPIVHVDYTTKSGFERLDALMPKEEAERLKKTPFAAIQVR